MGFEVLFANFTVISAQATIGKAKLIIIAKIHTLKKEKRCILPPILIVSPILLWSEDEVSCLYQEIFQMQNDSNNSDPAMRGAASATAG